MTLAVAGCSAAPSPPLMSSYTETGRYGFTEKQLGDDLYEVTYLGPEVSTSRYRPAREGDAKPAKNLSYELALWRAAQLALANGKPAFDVVDEDTETEVETTRGYYPGFYSYPYWGIGYPYHHFHHPGLVFSGYYGGYDRTTLQAIVTLRVRLKDEGGEFEAASLIQELAAKYPMALSGEKSG